MAIFTSMRRSSRAYSGKRWLMVPLLLGASLLGTGFAAWGAFGRPWLPPRPGGGVRRDEALLREPFLHRLPGPPG